YPVPPSRVFEAWTNPQALRAWFAPNPAAEMPEVTVDLRVGGEYRFRLINPDNQEHCVSKRYQEIAPPSKLVFTWLWATALDRESLVTVELRESDNGTDLVLTHERFHDGPELQNHEHG